LNVFILISSITNCLISRFKSRISSLDKTDRYNKNCRPSLSFFASEYRRDLTGIYSLFIEGSLGVHWGFIEGCLGVSRARPLWTPNEPPLNPEQMPTIERTYPDRMASRKSRCQKQNAGNKPMLLSLMKLQCHKDKTDFGTESESD